MGKLIGFWLVSLIVVGMLASAVTAQITRTPPRVMTGGDLGFRVEGTDRSGKPVGALVIRLNGEWVEVGSGMKAMPATSR